MLFSLWRIVKWQRKTTTLEVAPVRLQPEVRDETFIITARNTVNGLLYVLWFVSPVCSVYEFLCTFCSCLNIYFNTNTKTFWTNLHGVMIYHIWCNRFNLAVYSVVILNQFACFRKEMLIITLSYSKITGNTLQKFMSFANV